METKVVVDFAEALVVWDSMVQVKVVEQAPVATEASASVELDCLAKVLREVMEVVSLVMEEANMGLERVVVMQHLQQARRTCRPGRVSELVTDRATGWSRKSLTARLLCTSS